MTHRLDCYNRKCPGCGNDSDIAKLKLRIKTLEEENRQLREALNKAVGPYISEG